MRDDYRFRDEWLLDGVASRAEIGALAEQRSGHPAEQDIVASMQAR